MDQDASIRSHELRFSTEAFSLSAIKKAAYRFSGQCAFDLRLDGTDIVCSLLFAEPRAAGSIAELEIGIRNEVLDQDLREAIASETAPIRNAVLAMAFSKTGLQSADEV